MPNMISPMPKPAIMPITKKKIMDTMKKMVDTLLPKNPNQDPGVPTSGIPT